MRYLMTTIATLALAAQPIAAQVPVRPTPPNPPAQQGGPPAPLTQEQRDKQQAIRDKYAKELQAQRDAMQALNEKMRAEIEATLTPEQRARMPQGGGRGAAQAPGGMRAMRMGPPPGRPGAAVRRRAQVMMWNRAAPMRRAMLIKQSRRAMRARQARRGGGMMGQGMGGMGQGAMPPGQGGGRMGQGMMGGMNDQMQPPPAPAKAKAKAVKVPPTPGKPPVKPGGGGEQ